MGMLARGEKELLLHPLCAHVDTAKMLARELPSLPYVPVIKGAADTTQSAQCDVGQHGANARMYDRHLDPRMEPTFESEFGPCLAVWTA